MLSIYMLICNQYQDICSVKLKTSMFDQMNNPIQKHVF